MSYHEGVPGHHLQISIAQESKDIPTLRKLGFFSAYSEGWALYAEQLAGELGVYDHDPLGRGLVRAVLILWLILLLLLSLAGHLRPQRGGVR